MKTKARAKQLYEMALDTSDDPVEAYEYFRTNGNDLALKCASATRGKRKELFEELEANTEALALAEKTLKELRIVPPSQCFERIYAATSDLHAAGADPASLVNALLEATLRAAMIGEDEKRGMACLERGVRFFEGALRAEKRKKRK